MIETIKGANTSGFGGVFNRLNKDDFPLLGLMPQGLVALSPTILRHLAWQYDIDISGMTLEQQRQAVRGAIALHRRRGTKWAIRKALDWQGFRSVSIVEGSTSDLLHNGVWERDGNETHGGDLEHWATFKVSAIAKDGFDCQRMYRAIRRAKNVRARLIGVDIHLEVTMVFSDVPDSMRFVTASEIVPVSYIEDGYNIIIVMQSEHGGFEFTGLQGVKNGEVVGEVTFGVLLRKKQCAVTVLVSSNISVGYSAPFDSEGASFDDSFTEFDN